MNKIFDESRISTFKNLNDLINSNKLVGRREIIIGLDKKGIDELRDYIFRINQVIDYLKLFDDNSSLIDHSIIKGALNILGEKR